MNGLKETLATKRNYYALLIAIIAKKSATQSMVAMGICPDKEK